MAENLFLITPTDTNDCLRSQTDTDIVTLKSFILRQTLYSSCLSSTISRVLYQTIIFLDCTLPHSSSARLPGQNATNPEARRAAVSLPIRPCFGWSLHSLVCYQPSGGLLPRHSTITCRKAAGCFFSIALVLESPPPDVIRHPAL